MICESVALPDLGTRAIKYPLAKRNLGRRHRRHLCHHIINHRTKNPYPPSPGALNVLVYFHLRPMYHLCTSGKNRLSKYTNCQKSTFYCEFLCIIETNTRTKNQRASKFNYVSVSSHLFRRKVGGAK